CIGGRLSPRAWRRTSRRRCGGGTSACTCPTRACRSPGRASEGMHTSMSGGPAASHQDRSLLRLRPPLVETSWGGSDAVFYGSLTLNAPDIADHFPPFARVLGVPGQHHTHAVADSARFLGAIEEFVTGSRPAP